MCQRPGFKISQTTVAGLIVLLGGICILAACNREPAQKQPSMKTPLSNEVLIKFKPGVPEDSVQALASRLGLEHVRDLHEIGVRVFRTTSRFTTEQVLRACQSDACIEYAEPNRTVKIPENN